jgi:hypothetical protein
MLRLQVDPSLSAQQVISFTTTEGTPVRVTLTWNERSQFWYIDLTQTLSDGTTSSFYGVKLTPSFPVLSGVKNLYTFPGDFLLLPVQSTVVTDPVGYADLGTLWFLCWISDAEATAWKASYGI